MWLKGEYEYEVKTCFEEVLGYFETEGLAHQFLKERFYKPVRINSKGREIYQKPLPCVMVVTRVRKEQRR